MQKQIEEMERKLKAMQTIQQERAGDQVNGLVVSQLYYYQESNLTSDS